MPEASESHFYAISARHDSARYQQRDFEAIDARYLERGFSGVLYMGKVFDEVFSFSIEPELPEGCSTTLSIPELSIDRPFVLKRLIWLLSDHNKLGGTEPDDHFLIMEISFPNGDSYPALKSRGLKDKAIVDAFLNAIRQIPALDPFHDKIDVFHVDYPGFLSCHFQTSEDKSAEHVKPYLFAFFYYAHLICWRLERSQIALDLLAGKEPGPKTLTEITHQRVRIINLNRYFLTHNRTSNRYLAQFCSQRVAAHKIIEKYDRYKDILDCFETYTRNLNEISRTRGNRAVKQTLNLLAFFAIPLGIFGAIMQLSPDTDIIKKPQDVLTNGDIWFWIGFSFIMPLLLISMGYLYDRYADSNERD